MRSLRVLIVLLVLGSATNLQAEEVVEENSPPPLVCDAVCRYPAEKLLEDQAAIEAGRHRAAQWERWHPQETHRDSLSELDPLSRALLRDAHRPRPVPMPMLPMMFSCTSVDIGGFVNTDCF